MKNRITPVFAPALVAVLSWLTLGCAAESPDVTQTSGARTTAARRAGSRPTGAERVEIAGRQVSVWRPASTSTGRAPIVVFSHGFHGSSTQSATLMRALAADGYLVVAPAHKDATPGVIGRLTDRPDVSFGKPGKWSPSMYRDRGEDITAIVSAMKEDEPWSAAVEWSQVALAGHSLGGYTVLGLAGGWPEWKMPNVKAVLALSPFAAPFVSHGTLGAVDVPVMYQSGTRDTAGIRSNARKEGGAFDMTPPPAYYVEFRGAGHFAWTDLNAKHQESIAYYSLAFLNRHVRGDRTAGVDTRRADVADLRAQ